MKKRKRVFAQHYSQGDGLFLLKNGLPENNGAWKEIMRASTSEFDATRTHIYPLSP